ncbi:MAG: phage holin family protein [Coriobacteriia bacterium]
MPDPGEPKKDSVTAIIDSVADLLQTATDWVRQEAEAVVREKIVAPIQRLGLTLASASAAGCLAVVGLIFIAVAMFLVLAEWLTYPGALLAIGAVYLIGSIIFVIIKVRLMQK